MSLVGQLLDQGEDMIDVQEWAEIRQRHAQGQSIKSIARHMGLARNTIRTAVRSEEPPAYERPSPGSKLEPYTADISALLKGEDDIPGKRVWEMITAKGFRGGQTIVNDYLRQVRPLFQRPRVFQRTTYEPGELAQWDLWEPDPIPVGFGHRRRGYVITGALGYSKMGAGTLVFSKAAPDLLYGIDRGLSRLGGVPGTCVFDREGALCADKAVKDPRPTDPLARYAGALGFGVHFRPRADPQGKGVVERINGYLETSFVPGRRFSSPEDFQAQLDAWFDEVANVRFHRTLRCRPFDRYAEEAAALRPLPSVRPDLTWRFHAPVRPDPYVRVDTCDYSVHPDAVGLVVEVRVTQREVVCVTKDGREVARHVRSFAPHRTITAAAHGRAVRERREARSRPPLPPEPEVEVRDLAVYDRAFGVLPGDGVDQELDLGSENGSRGLSEPRLLEGAAR